MRERRVEKRLIDAQVKKMKMVSYKNQNKQPEEDWAVAEQQPASQYNSSDEEAEMEDMQMFEAEDGSSHIDLRYQINEIINLQTIKDWLEDDTVPPAWKYRSHNHTAI